MSRFEAEQHEEDKNRFYVMVDDKFDVRIIRTDEGIVVDIYPYDGLEAVASTYAFESEIDEQEDAA
jgi:hypothetical protein